MPLRRANWTENARWNREQFELSRYPSRPRYLQVLWSKMCHEGPLDRKGRESKSYRKFVRAMKRHQANRRAMQLGNPPPYPQLVEPLPACQFIEASSNQIVDRVTTKADKSALVLFNRPDTDGFADGDADGYEIDDFTRPDDEIVYMQHGDVAVAPPLEGPEPLPPSDVAMAPVVGSEEAPVIID